MSDSIRKSNRKDGRGGRLAGVRRNVPGPRWPGVRKRLAEALTGERGARTYAVVGDDLGVADRTVRRWVVGEDWPDAETVERLDAWCDDPTSVLRARIAELGREGIAQVAELLGISLTAAREAIRNGPLEPVQIRTLRRWLREVR